MAFELTAAPPNDLHAGRIAAASIRVPGIEPVVSPAIKNRLTPMRGPQPYDSSPVATTDVVYLDKSGFRLCFLEAHLRTRIRP